MIQTYNNIFLTAHPAFFQKKFYLSRLYYIYLLTVYTWFTFDRRATPRTRARHPNGGDGHLPYFLD